MAGFEPQPRLSGQLLKQTLIANATLEANRQTAPNSENEELLDPKTTERRYWRDPHSGTQREIWRPGDGDGEIEHDHFERKGPVAPLDKRWRLYQLSPGPFTARINEPPSNVILDDRAVWEILNSNIPRAQLAKRWSHDFSGQANIRHRRPHRGRPAVKDENAEAETDKYQSWKTSSSAKVPPYYFFGEKDFTPTFYQELPRAAEEAEPIDDTPDKPKQHNQYTAPELLVRNGAQSASLTKGKYRPRVNTFLRRSPSPPWVKDRSRLFGGIGIGRAPSTAPVTPGGFDFSFASATAPIGAAASKESMWVEQDEEPEPEESEEDEDGEFPSIFDKTLSSGAPGNDVDSSTPMAHAAMRKRRASPSRFFNRTKRPRQMGYIERLAAGISEEDAIAEANARVEEVTEPTNVEDNNDELDQLRSELETAKNAIIDKDDEIALLKAQVESMQAQMAPVAEDH